MSVPKFRNSRSRVRRRRAHHALKDVPVTGCPNCKAPAQPHTACASCGQYRGRSLSKVEEPKAPAKPKAEKVKKKTETKDKA